jgi:uncharacterized damage-inducible protein DinB
MGNLEFIKESAKSARKWRDMNLEKMNNEGLTDLSYRPRTGMSSLGWVLAHQGAVYDFSLNILILRGQASNPDLFKKHIPGTSGDWTSISLEEIHKYYDDSEKQFLNWAESATPDDMTRRIEEGEAPDFFVGMTVREVITYMFAHLNYHTGHLSAILRDWLVK